MARPSSVMKMPEFLVFVRAFAIGVVGAEVFRLAFYLGEGLALLLYGVGWWAQAGLVAACLLICLTYARKREALTASVRLGRSLRIDLLAAVLIGIWSNVLVAPWLNSGHKLVKQSSSQVAPAVLAMLLLVLLSPLVRIYWPRSEKKRPQLYFLADEEIRDRDQDLFASETQAKSFAETVLASGAHSGLVFGIDGPWGVGKTSFINLAERHWSNEDDSTIVFRFEPLRYASEPDLSERFIRDLSAIIQKQVFAPEFRPAASRYSRMLKGKADISFLGFKLSLEPTGETIDELLDDIDEVLKRIGRRVIVVVDDLDRLEAKTVNNVLFTIRRTFKLSQATYILCYDTENLANGKDDGERAREFLEKFVTVKLSLFVDSSTIQRFLERDWKREEQSRLLVPSDSMVKLASVLSELADILRGEKAARYMSLVGDLRKVKRFVNAVLLMQIERTDLSKTDFNRRDLVNLMLLHLNYPGLFRHVYVEETEGRSGIFSVKRKSGNREFSNSEALIGLLECDKGLGGFLLAQLFDVKELGLGASDVDEPVQRSRACFNQGEHRNLEKYLKLIVRFVTPEPRETFRLYQEAVERVRRGEKISAVLDEDEFRLADGEHAQDQFWRLVVNQAHDFPPSIAGDAINALVAYLPKYSSVEVFGRGMRTRSIYSILRLLDRVRWGGANGRASSDSLKSRLDIAHRLWGEGEHTGQGLLCRLVEEDRGVLGWNDLMLFRLQCSADRQGQLFNVQAALLLYEDNAASTTGLLSELAVKGMRRLSQKVFALFRGAFIEQKRNFLAEVDEAPAAMFFGAAEAILKSESANLEAKGQAPLAERIAAARSAVKSFVLYQLSNRQPPVGAGVGCGFYDEVGAEDAGGIAKVMNEYVFDLCFDPQKEDGIYHFVDYCLSNLSSAFFSGDEDGYVPTKAGLLGGLDSLAMGRYWRRHREDFLKRNLPAVERRVVTSNYVATYREDLPRVFVVLDELSNEASEPAPEAELGVG